ncbi:MAG: 50S ribosomal protein L17 [Bacteroidetes bacterium]|nr:MAG: 50S ribosomal protein L17 [Bacteroidota bacterium]REK05154.1 MAG: 50S ribosomal protein L17 [Bacteroidota bacterium]REK32559.1 MAG: 50S ribosomal protein L17 [Bacteroidota bacterium]REK48994.1 MAG: 50S ribosomal protein L17 [Bacteroidota bacterium]
MRHGKKINHLGRQYGHRQALLSNMASSLILHKRINTTLAKAKALRKYVEPLITRSKDDSTHSRRIVFKYLQDKIAVSELFREVAPKIADRPGGYTRIIKLEPRLGDNAEMCMMELVDFNMHLLGGSEAAPAKKAAKTTRRGRKKKSDDVEAADSDSAPAAEAKATKKTAAKKAAPKKKKSDDSGDE